MVNRIYDSMNKPLSRRGLLKGAAAVGAFTAFPAIITRRGFPADTQTVVNSIRSLSSTYYPT